MTISEIINEEMLENKWRRYRRIAQRLAARIPVSDDWFRAGGGCICDDCGLSYIEHPVCSDGLLHVLCDGSQVKL